MSTDQGDRTYYVDFIPVGSTSDENEDTVLQYTIDARGDVKTTYKKDERFETDGSKITIGDVSLQDEGVYKCIIRFQGQKQIFKKELVVYVKEWIEI